MGTCCVCEVVRGEPLSSALCLCAANKQHYYLFAILQFRTQTPNDSLSLQLHTNELRMEFIVFYSDSDYYEIVWPHQQRRTGRKLPESERMGKMKQ